MAPKKVDKKAVKKGTVTNRPVKHDPPKKRKEVTKRAVAKTVTKSEEPPKVMIKRSMKTKKIQTAEGWKRAMMKMRKEGKS